MTTKTKPFSSYKINSITTNPNITNSNASISPATYRLVKTYNSEDYDDSSHTQLFFRLPDEEYQQRNNYIALLNTPPTYYREVIKPDERHNIFWFNEALMSVSGRNTAPFSPPQPTTPTTSDNRSTIKSRITISSRTPKTIWSIEPPKIKRSKILRKPRRPNRFTIKYVPTGSVSTFKKQTNDNESSSSSTIEYYGDVITPFDNTCLQRYKWVKSLESKKKCENKWTFVACNDPKTPLAEFRSSNVENEFDIVFFGQAPIGWNPNIADRLSRFSGLSGGRASDFESSLSNRESTHSSLCSFTSTISNVKSKYSFPVNSYNIIAEDDGRYWQEYILASTVAIQDEVTSSKVSFNKRIRKFFG
ncbi:2368_t:CDS:2 [Ambispora gerdemannii]|uniref:2368_t:CDS:1 n=1 Tax=Ambispora gerdemannii TaxID=144530 RepID=A0A9N9AW93_9GLOM|nr:2368_t:CDS:2 [Ambispora gerdemannii]